MKTRADIQAVLNPEGNYPEGNYPQAEKKHPTYAQRRERLIEQVVSGYSLSYARARAELELTYPEYDAPHLEAYATALAYSRLMRGKHDENAVSIVSKMKSETVKKWADEIAAERNRRMEAILKYNPGYKYDPEAADASVIFKIAAELLQREEIMNRAVEGFNKAAYHFNRSLGSRV